MHLIYLDESGNSGTNLTDPQQPIFVLGAKKMRHLFIYFKLYLPHPVRRTTP